MNNIGLHFMCHLLYHIWSAMNREEVVTGRNIREKRELMLQKQVVTTGH